MMKNFVVIRRTLSWDTITWDRFLKRTFLHTEQSVYKFIIPIIRYWDKYCGLSYFKYRAGLKKIAMQSILSIPNVRVRRIRWYNSFLKRSRNTIAAFMDDDDWIAPDLFANVRLSDCTDGRIFVWNPTCVLYTSPTYSTCDFSKLSHDQIVQYTGLQYAMLGPSGFTGAYSQNLLGRVITCTNNHANWIIGNIDKINTITVDKNLSITNKSLGSTSQLKHFVATSDQYDHINNISSADKQQSINNFEKAICNLVRININKIPISLKWSIEYAKQLNDLNDRTFGCVS